MKNKTYILIDEKGVMPRIGKLGFADVTEMRDETPRYVYGEDNPAIKIAMWNALTGRKFMVQTSN